LLGPEAGSLDHTARVARPRVPGAAAVDRAAARGGASDRCACVAHRAARGRTADLIGFRAAVHRAVVLGAVVLRAVPAAARGAADAADPYARAIVDPDASLDRAARVGTARDVGELLGSGPDPRARAAHLAAGQRPSAVRCA